jgi:hypothetical protein
MDSGFRTPSSRARREGTRPSSRLTLAIFCANCQWPTVIGAEVGWPTTPQICVSCRADLASHAILTTTQAGQVRRLLGLMQRKPATRNVRDLIAVLAETVGDDLPFIRSEAETPETDFSDSYGAVESAVSRFRGTRGNRIESDRFAAATGCVQCRALVVRPGRAGEEIAIDRCPSNHLIDGLGVLSESQLPLFERYGVSSITQRQARQARALGIRVLPDS